MTIITIIPARLIGTDLHELYGEGKSREDTCTASEVIQEKVPNPH